MKPTLPAATARIAAALDAARRAARTPPPPRAAANIQRPIRVAIGDPQAPLETFFRILAHHDLLTDAGRLRDDAQLVSIGDHFDWGRPDQRDDARTSGLHLLAWLASHPADQVVILAGNHDVARVSELATVTDAHFATMQTAADRVRDAPPHAAPALLADFRRLAPTIPDPELIFRDLASFTERQRDLVRALLATGRLRAAHAAAGNLLLTHAGLTVDDLDAVGVPPADRSDATAVADVLNAAFDAAVARWLDADPATPFTWPGLHHPGDARGEGRGIFFHRPSNPRHETDADLFGGPVRRRFDARRLPIGLTQAVGHTEDRKCRDMLGPWADDADAAHGILRHLRTDGRDAVRYAHGTPRDAAPDTATLLFLDGGMAKRPADGYALLDLVTHRPYSPSRAG